MSREIFHDASHKPYHVDSICTAKPNASFCYVFLSAHVDQLTGDRATGVGQGLTFLRASSALTWAGVRRGEAIAEDAVAGVLRASLEGALAGRGRRGVDELPLRLETRPEEQEERSGAVLRRYEYTQMPIQRKPQQRQGSRIYMAYQVKKTCYRLGSKHHLLHGVLNNIDVGHDIIDKSSGPQPYPSSSQTDPVSQ